MASGTGFCFFSYRYPFTISVLHSNRGLPDIKSIFDNKVDASGFYAAESDKVILLVVLLG